MLNRRHLRVKALQALYAWHQSEQKEAKIYEKALLGSIDKVYEMYIRMLSFFVEVAQYSQVDVADRSNKFRPTEEDLNASDKLFHNAFIQSLLKNDEYHAAVKKYKISWNFDPELVRSAFTTLKGTPEYKEFLADTDQSIGRSKDIIKHIFKKVFLKSAGLEQAFEELFMAWPVDKEVLQALVAKTFKNFSSEDPSKNKLAQISPDWEDDRVFVIDLLNRYIAFEAEYQKYIIAKTKNWDADRIAMMDTILMKMAITELVHFPSIPVKVTINEYIEISKEFSTPKSNSFINGILDKILADLNKEGKIRKSGRGLIE